MSNQLFDEFPPVSSKQWKQKIQFDLKGADYNSTLLWTSNEGIQVKPFYHADDFKETPCLSNTKISAFKICETIYVADEEKSNKNALSAIKSGAESIKFIIPSQNVSILNVLQNINLDETPIFLELLFTSLEFAKEVLKIKSKAGIYLNKDIIGNLAKSGNWHDGYKKDFDFFSDTISNQPTETNHNLSINSNLYQNAGANIIQQLSYTLAHANEYFNYIENKAFKTSFNVVFNVSVGTNYFFEIAKLKALRRLFSLISQEYQANYKCSIFATPTKRNKTIYDYNTNLLRTTTECMSAILGGADFVSNLAFDTVFRKTNTFSSRIARNQLLILKNESYFNAVNNPSDGSYYIENLTNQFTEKALVLFKSIEASGGFLKQLKEGTIQRKVKESALKEQTQFENGEEIIIGSNSYLNENDTMKDKLELFPFVKINKRKTLIEPIIEKRLTENLEQKRLKNENL